MAVRRWGEELLEAARGMGRPGWWRAPDRESLPTEYKRLAAAILAWETNVENEPNTEDDGA